MRYADDSCRSALLQRLLALREREPYGAALDMRFASETQPDPNPLPPYVRFRAANINRRPSARDPQPTVANDRYWAGQLRLRLNALNGEPAVHMGRSKACDRQRRCRSV